MRKPERPSRRLPAAGRPCLRYGTLAIAGFALGACGGQTAATGAAADQVNDPYESTNRFFYSVDDKLDRYALKPVAEGYIYVVPSPVRGSVHNVLSNLASPVLFADDVSQANPRRAGDTFMRFIINSTVGGLGAFDVATGWGYPHHDTDFGVTLALWGVPSGPFLYLPVLGPSSPRAVAGYGADIALDPFTWVPRGYGLLTFNWARNGVNVIDVRSRLIPDLDKVKAGALDPYATFRSLYQQNLASKIEAARHDEPGTPPLWVTPAIQPGEPSQSGK
jgi:phospholipid-binding lipoprotein MlaA